MGWDGKLDATDKKASKALSAMEKAGLYDSNTIGDAAKREAGVKKLMADKRAGTKYAVQLLKDQNKAKSGAIAKAKSKITKEPSAPAGSISYEEYKKMKQNGTFKGFDGMNGISGKGVKG